MDMVMEHFRRHVESQTTHAQKSSSHSAFQATTQQPPQAQKGSVQNTPIFRGRQPHQPPSSSSPVRDCICGMLHRYANCWYLHPELARPGWQPSSDTQQRVETALQNPNTRRIINRHRARYDQQRQSAPDAPQINQNHTNNAYNSDDEGAFTAFSNHTSSGHHPLQDSWVYDSGSDRHICNSSMHHRLFDYEPVRTNEFVLSGTAMPIQGYGKLRINATKRGQHITILLLNVAYITDYPTNFISISIVEDKRVH